VATVDLLNLRSRPVPRGVALPEINSDSDSLSDNGDQADWALDPLFQQGIATPAGTPVQQGHAHGVPAEAAALGCMSTPRQLDFAVAESPQLRSG
jgi:hypothetical protein